MTAVLPCTSRALAATPRAGTRPVERWTRCVLSPFPAMLSPRLAPLAVPAVFAVLAACGGSEPAPAPPPPALPAPLPAPPAVAPASVVPTPPPTERRTVVDEFFGTKVNDDYRWLEDWTSPDVKRWSDAQNAFARAHLDAIPSRARLRDRLTELIAEPAPRYFDLRFRKATLFALELVPPKQQPMLVAMTAAADPTSQRVVLDPAVVDPSGGTEIDFFVPSLDGKRVAVSLSKGGSEDGTVHVYDVESGKERGDAIPRVNGGTAGGSLAWNADGSGFYYTRYPHAGERPPQDLDFYQQVYFHKLGTPPDKDAYAVGKDFPRIAEVVLRSSDDGRFVLARVANGDGGEFAYWWASQGKAWSKMGDFADGVVDARFGPDDALYLLSQKGAPRRRILRLDPDPQACGSDRGRARRRAPSSRISRSARRSSIRSTWWGARRRCGSSASTGRRRRQAGRNAAHPPGLDGRPYRAPRRRRDPLR